MWRQRGWPRAAIVSLLALALVSTIYLSAQPRRQRVWLENTFINLLVPIQRGLSTVSHGLASGIGWFGDIARARQENQALKAEVARLRSEREAWLLVAHENLALREMLRLARGSRHELLVAEVIARSPSNWDDLLTVNRGSKHGVKPGMAVVAPSGVVGQVRSVTADSSRILLLTDARSAIGGSNRRTNQPVLVEGSQDPKGSLTARPLTQDHAMKAGDVLLTSGYSDIYPKGVPIGKVVSVRAGRYGLSQVATVKPFVDLGRLDWVAIVVRSDPSGQWPEPSASQGRNPGALRWPPGIGS